MWDLSWGGTAHSIEVTPLRSKWLRHAGCLKRSLVGRRRRSGKTIFPAMEKWERGGCQKPSHGAGVRVGAVLRTSLAAEGLKCRHNSIALSCSCSIPINASTRGLHCSQPAADLPPLESSWWAGSGQQSLVLTWCFLKPLLIPDVSQ